MDMYLLDIVCFEDSVVHLDNMYTLSHSKNEKVEEIFEQWGILGLS